MCRCTVSYWEPTWITCLRVPQRETSRFHCSFYRLRWHFFFISSGHETQPESFFLPRMKLKIHPESQEDITSYEDAVAWPMWTSTLYCLLCLVYDEAQSMFSHYTLRYSEMTLIAQSHRVGTSESTLTDFFFPSSHLNAGSSLWIAAVWKCLSNNRGVRGTV